MRSITNYQLPINNLAFTLIELLVVIAIIGSLSALFLPNFMAARERARDAQRKSDLKTIQKAFEMYKQDKTPEAYPASLPPGGSCFSSNYPTNCTGSVYASRFPKDPLSSYRYVYNRVGLTYTLCACLENEADPDGVSASCTGFICTSGKSYIVTEP